MRDFINKSPNVLIKFRKDIKESVIEVRRLYILMSIEELDKERNELLAYRDETQESRTIPNRTRHRIIFGIDVLLNELLAIKNRKQEKLEKKNG